MNRARDRIAAAFSPRANFRCLIDRHDARLSPIDGLRALAVLWIILMHCVWFQAPFRGGEQGPRLIEDAPVWILGGPYGVDVFFVISGFLIGMILMRERQKRGTIRVGRFYFRRFLKLMPAYFAALAIYVALGGANPDMVWTNLIYVNNFVPGPRQAMVWSWSLAIEEQFYFTFPCFLLLVFFRVRRRWALLGLLFALSLAIRAILLNHHGISAPIAWSLGVESEKFLTWAEEIYIKPHTRFGCLLAGVAAAYAYLFHDVGRFFRSRPKTAAAGLALSGAVIALVVQATAHSDVTPWNPAASLLFLTSYRNVLGLATAYIILYSLHPHGVLGRALSGFLSWRPWYAVAQLAYSAYLLHPMVMLVVYSAIAPEDLRRIPMVVFYVSLPVLCFAAATILYVGIERPFTSLRDVLNPSRAWSPASSGAAEAFGDEKGRRPGFETVQDAAN